MADEPTEKLTEAQTLAEIAKTSEGKQMVVDAILGVVRTPRGRRPRPEGYSKLSNTPYYNEKFANDLKPWLDKLIATKEPCEFSYEGNNLARSTLYNKIHQSWHYLMWMERNSTEKPYTLLYNSCNRHLGRNGVRIEYKTTGPDTPLVGRAVKPTVTINTWRQKLDKWIMEAPMESRFEDKKVSLSVEEIDELRVILGGLPNVYSKVEEHRILVIKTKEKMQ